MGNLRERRGGEAFAGGVFVDGDSGNE